MDETVIKANLCKLGAWIARDFEEKAMPNALGLAIGERIRELTLLYVARNLNAEAQPPLVSD